MVLVVVSSSSSSGAICVMSEFILATTPTTRHTGARPPPQTSRRRAPRPRFNPLNPLRRPVFDAALGYHPFIHSLAYCKEHSRTDNLQIQIQIFIDIHAS